MSISKRQFGLICAATLLMASPFQAGIAQEGALDVTKLPYFEKMDAASKSGVGNYAATKSPKALAINPGGRIYWWGAEGQQAEISRRALENCELVAKSPCVLGAISDTIQKLNPEARPESAFSKLGGDLDPSQVPFLSDARRKGLASAYAQARKFSLQYMALALNPRNGWFLKVDPAYKSQAEADQAAVTACVTSPPLNKFWNPASCFLYAQGTKVVADLPLGPKYASAELVQSAVPGPVVQRDVSEPAQPVLVVAKADVVSKATGQHINPDRIRFVHTGGGDCPPCVVWRLLELPKLQKSPTFQAINFSIVEKNIGSPFPPSEMFLPAELKPLRAKLQLATSGRRGSPQQLFIVDGEVYEYKPGAPLDAKEIEARIAAITSGTTYPVSRCIRSSEQSRCLQFAESK